MNSVHGLFGVLDNIRSVSVTVRKGLVHITGFPYDAFSKFVAKQYKTHVFLDKMVEHTLTRSVIFYEFFVPEFVYLLNLAAEHRAINNIRASEIIDALYQKTWFGKSLKDVKTIVDPANWDKEIVPTIRPLPHQREFVCDVYWQKKIQYSLNGYLLALPTGAGKALKNGTPVKVPGGWKPVEDLQIGDKVISVDGTPSTVLGVFPQGIKQMFRITFKDGRYVDTSEDHLWTIYDQRQRSSEWRTRTTGELFDIANKSKHLSRISIPICKSEQIDDVDLPIDPYVLGVILGDGSIVQSTPSVITDRWIINKIIPLMPEGMGTRINKVYENADVVMCSFSGVQTKSNPLTDKLRELKLYGCNAYTKHIPEIYLNASTQQRVKLLQGLMDTDGYVGSPRKYGEHGPCSGTSGNITYSTSSEILSQQIQYLIRSIGGKCSIKSKVPFYRYKGEYKTGHPCWLLRISVPTPSILFSLPRKRERTADENQYTKNWKLPIVSVEVLTEKSECTCIAIDHPSRLFVTKDFIVTHNSKASLFLASGLGKKHYVIICPLSTVKNVWVSEVRELFIKKKSIVTSYDSPNDVTYDTDILIINYESIDKFTPAILKNFDASSTIIIVDESHNFKDIKAQRTQFLLKLAHDFHCEDLLLMSGTPIKALGVECIPIFAALDNYCNDEVILKLKDLNRMPLIMNELLRNRMGMLMYRRNKEEILKLPEKHEEEILIKIPDGNKFTLENVKQICREYRKERTKYYKKHYKEYEDTWYECLGIYEKTITTRSERMEYNQYLANVAFIRQVGVSAETTQIVSDMKQFEITRIYPVLTNAERKAFKEATVVVKYVSLKILGEILGNVLGKLREEMTTAMIGPEILDIIDKAEKKTIVFTSYSASIKRMEEVCKAAKMKPITVTGANSKNAKEIVDQFKTKDNINPLIASIKAMSTGHTIICANTVIFLNVPFRSVDYEQASDRVYRIGQDSDVYIYKIFLDTGEEPNLSTRMSDIIAWSKQQFDAIIGDGDDDIDPKLINQIRSAIEDLGSTGFAQKALKTIVDGISTICKKLGNTDNTIIAGEEGYTMSDSHVENYEGEENGLVPDAPKEEPKLSDGHVEDYEGEENGLVPDPSKEEPKLRSPYEQSQMNENDPEDYKGEKDGLKPDPAEFPDDAPQHEDVAKGNDIKDTEPEDDPLTPEVSSGATKSPTGSYTPDIEPIPGFFKYMHSSMEEDEELTALTIPAPTKEKGDATPEPHVRDVDDKDPHDPGEVDIVIDIEQNRDEERQMALLRRRRELFRYLDGVEAYLKNYNLGRVGQEGFVANFVTGVVNVVGHILNLFNAGVLQGWRNFKRGELTAYSDSNRATMTRIYFADFYQISEVEVDTPQGMEGPYAPALNSLCTYLVELNMLDRAIRMLKTVECIERDMHKQNSNFTSTIVDANKSFTDPKLAKLFQDTTKYFTPKKSDGGKFRELFANMKEYETVIKQAIDEDDHLRQVSSVHSRLEDIQKVVNRIADDAELLTKPQLEDLAKVARAMADTFDNYGTVIADVLRVQHNLTEVTKRIRKALAM